MCHLYSICKKRKCDVPRKSAVSPLCQQHDDEVLKELLIDYSTVARVCKEEILFECYDIRIFSNLLKLLKEQCCSLVCAPLDYLNDKIFRLHF